MLPETRNTLILNVMSHMQQTGETLTRACAEVGIGYSNYFLTVRANPVLQQMHDEAISIAQDILADQLVNIDKLVPDPKMAAVISKNIHWLLSRRQPQKYGDKITVQHETSRDKAIIARLQAAKRRAVPALDHGPVEDAVELSAPSEQRTLELLGLG